MESALLFIFMGILSVMFLGMLYGDRLSMMGLFDGDWLSPIGTVSARLWSGLCQSVDEGIEFVLAHLSWVVAAVSGTAGLVLVAFIMGGGLASDAAAYHRDTVVPLRSGGVIDKVEVVSTRASQAPIILAKADRDDSLLVSQVRSADYVVFDRPEYAPIRPRPRRPIEGSIDFPPRSISDRPILGLTFRRLGTSILRSDLNPDVITRGRLVDSLPNAFLIDRLVSQLRQDNWREALGLPRDDAGLPQDNLPESPLAAVRDLESRIRVTPGAYVSRQDLRVEKTVPEETASGDITIQIALTNLGKQTIDGLLVREMLPMNTQVRGASPEGLLRNDTLTWLVNDLRPSEENMIRLTVIPSERSNTAAGRTARFESMTEVSALTAVASRTRVESEEPVEQPFPADRIRRETQPRRELVGTPDLRLEIEEPQESARVGEWTQILFTLSNEGTSAASSIRLRLTLDNALDHSDLLNRPATERQVFVDVDRVAVGQSRRFRLEVRPNFRGETLSTAEVILDGNRVDRKTFRLVARDTVDPRVRPESTIR